MILNATEGRPLPVYGDGGHVRDWLHVDDHAEALLLVLQKGRLGETYCIGGDATKRAPGAVTTSVTWLTPDLPATVKLIALVTAAAPTSVTDSLAPSR